MYSHSAPLFSLRQSTDIFAQHLTAVERAWLVDKGEIIFVSQSDYPPFEFIDTDHNRAGMCIELVRWIATEFGFKARFRDMTFQEAQQAILSGKADVLTSFFTQEAQLKV
ncbi:MAG: transporter substrate-binding domain-containing protein [Deltaproteobacteria bacterium]|nr:transporter substrate-binding domain-containing protein [Candidatus Tharpella sp.]